MKTLTHCTFCTGELTEVLDMGRMALPGAFLRQRHPDVEAFYPLRLAFCDGCGGVQLLDQVPDAALFSDYFYFSSSIASVKAHAERYAREMVTRYKPYSVVEIGCNDGVMLTALADMVPEAYGIDPSRAAARINHPKVTVFNEYLGGQSVTADLVIANNVFAHIDDIHGAAESVRRMLNPNGVFVMEVQHLGAMVERTQYDWIYHEHRYYWSLRALSQLLRQHGLEVFDVELIPMHGGSMRVHAGHMGCRARRGRVFQLIMEEEAQGLDRAETFRDFARAALDRRNALSDAVRAIDGTVAAYGASGRGNTILQWAGLKDAVSFVVDDAPEKVGHFTPGTHLPIHKPEALDAMNPSAVLLLAWPYRDKIEPKCGGRPVIVPLPDVVLTDWRAAA